MDQAFESRGEWVVPAHVVADWFEVAGQNLSRILERNWRKFYRDAWQLSPEEYEVLLGQSVQAKGKEISGGNRDPVWVLTDVGIVRIADRLQSIRADTLSDWAYEVIRTYLHNEKAQEAVNEDHAARNVPIPPEVPLGPPNIDPALLLSEEERVRKTEGFIELEAVRPGTTNLGPGRFKKLIRLIKVRFTPSSRVSRTGSRWPLARHADEIPSPINARGPRTAQSRRGLSQMTL